MAQITGAIKQKTDRTSWSKTLVELSISELREKRTALEKYRGFALFGFSEKKKSQQYEVMSKLDDIDARKGIINDLIRKRKNETLSTSDSELE